MATKKEKSPTFLQLSGVELRSWTGKVVEGGILHRIKFMASLTPAVAKFLKCLDVFYDAKEVLRDTGDNRSTDGILNVGKLKLKANGMAAELTLDDCQEAEYKAYQVAPKDENAKADAHVMIAVTISSTLQIVEEYAAVAGTAPGTMKVWLKASKQTTIEDVQEDGTIPFPAADGEADEAVQ